MPLKLKYETITVVLLGIQKLLEQQVGPEDLPDCENVALL